MKQKRHRHVSPLESSSSGEVVKSPPPKRLRSRGGSFTGIKPSPGQLFHGYYFLLTSIKRGECCYSIVNILLVLLLLRFVGKINAEGVTINRRHKNSYSFHSVTPAFLRGVRSFLKSLKLGNGNFTDLL